VLKAAEAGKGDDGTYLRRLDRPVVRGVLREGEMRAILVVPGLELSEQPSRVSFTDHDDAIEELAADGPDETLGVAVHLRRADGGLDGPNAQTPDSMGELLSICSVAIWRMSRRTSARALGRPPSDFRFQKRRNACRCQATTISGLTMTRFWRHPEEP
jgi:hypothetical protein